MYIVKYIKSKYYENTLKGEGIRIGTFNYYKKIEDDTLRDEKEGFGTVSVVGNNIKSNFLNNIFSMKFDPDIEIRFEAGKGKITSDISVNAFIYSTIIIDKLEEIEEIRQKRFSDKDKHFFLSDEHTFETRCANFMKNQFKELYPKEPIYLYCFAKKVEYFDIPKETIINYNEIENTDSLLKANLAFLFEKPTEFKDEKEFRFVWFAINKSLDADYKLYHIYDNPYDINIDPEGCISESPAQFIPSKKHISFWDLN